MVIDIASITTDKFVSLLYEKMQLINPGIKALELYEFRYGLNNLQPAQGDWRGIHLQDCNTLEQRVNDIDFYYAIQLKPRAGERIILDSPIVSLTNMLFVGLASGVYSTEWVRQHFYFDIRGFYFLHRTRYFTPEVISRFGGHPFLQFARQQDKFDAYQDLGYQEFKAANTEVDQAFMHNAQKLARTRGVPVVLAIAGPTAAGKTEIVERLHSAFRSSGQKTTSIELDNFLTDRDYREEKGIHTQGKAAYHLELLQQCLENICLGKPVTTPRYDFVFATSSHDLDGRLKPGGMAVEVEPADIIFIEGNFPFLIEEVSHLIGIKVVYLTDDPIRLKRKWKRDIDYRKKYEPTYFRNRFFKDQFIMAHLAYIPQMQICDMVVDTTGSALWATPQVQTILNVDQSDNLPVNK